MKRALLEALNEARADRRAAILVSELATGSQRLVLEDEGFAGDPLEAEFAARFASAKSGMIETPTGDVFLTVHVPPPRLIVIGAVHISQALAPMAAIAGFHVEIVDPRTAFASEDRFPGVNLHADWPEDVLPGLAVDRFTALAALTHDPKIDDWALQHAIERGCFYIGALGSRKTHGKRVERLTAAGLSEAALAAIRAPIGLDIRAQSPAEIAVAVLAQVIEALRKRDATESAVPKQGANAA